MSFKTDAGPEPVDLSIFDDEFERAEVQRPPQYEPDEIPDGLYDARVEDASLSRTLNTGNAMLLWRLRILGPEHAGRAITKVRVITSKTLPYLKEDLRRLDVNLDRLSELPQHLDEMVDREISVLKRTQPDRRWTDVYFLRKPPQRQEPASAEPAWTGTDDDLPF